MSTEGAGLGMAGNLGTLVVLEYIVCLNQLYYEHLVNHGVLVKIKKVLDV